MVTSLILPAMFDILGAVQPHNFFRMREREGNQAVMDQGKIGSYRSIFDVWASVVLNVLG